MDRASARQGSTRGSEATLHLGTLPTSVFALEDFVDSLDFLSQRERQRLKLAGDEILDNLIRHAAPLHGDRIVVRAARRGERIHLGFFFRSPTFASFAARCSDPLPLFDPAHRRWRGIGMVMCKNLADAITLRPGSFVDRIFLSFHPEADAPAPGVWRQRGSARRGPCFAANSGSPAEHVGK